MKPALLLVDLQRDYLERPGLLPRAASLVEQAARLLRACRQRAIPIIHVHTLVRPDGSDRMPHWRDGECWNCVAGTPGSLPPAELEPRPGEAVVAKQFFSAFGSPALGAALAGVDTLIVAGLYLHGCVRAAVFDAYERGFTVWVADEAVGSTEPDHAEITRLYLEGRAAAFLDTPTLLHRLGLPDEPSHYERRNPADWSEVIARVPLASGAEAAAAGEAAAEAQRAWQRQPSERRAALLDAWADGLTRQAEILTALLVREIGKPLADSRGEVRRAIALLRTSARLFRSERIDSIDADRRVQARYRPGGVLGLITPWNNPVGIAVGKLAPALALGNGVVWKPALEAPQTAQAVLESLRQAGLPPGLVGLVLGGAATARQVMDHPRVSAVSLTGSIAAGRSAAARCLRLGKPLQGELGGNNAAIVWRGADLAGQARALALAAFAFAGQRCTAIRRLIVDRSIYAPLAAALREAVVSLRLGQPGEAATEIGPLISRNHRGEVMRTVAAGLRGGGRLLCGGSVPAGLEAGCWLTPALLDGVPAASPAVQEETFGPLAVLLPADDLDEALALANGVPQGLVASFLGGSAAEQAHFAESVQAGIIQFGAGPVDVHPAAPFGGWKASAIGPPEHGEWDRQFYARPQAVYGA